MKYLEGSFSVYPGSNQKYRDNYDSIFGKKEEKADLYANDRPAAPKEMSDLPPPRDAPAAPKKPKKTRGKKPKNEKPKKKKQK